VLGGEVRITQHHALALPRQLLEQCRRLILGQKSDASRRLLELPYGARPIQPQEIPQPSARIANHRYLLNILEKQYIAFITNQQYIVAQRGITVRTLLLQTPAQLPQHLKALRKHRGLTQVQLASRLGIKQARYAFIESHPDTVSAAQLLDVFAALGVDILLRVRADSKAARDGEDW
jgi:HTH-type transcriptional regulator/antitoxin HipB